jgi:hypothetical protein
MPWASDLLECQTPLSEVPNTEPMVHSDVCQHCTPEMFGATFEYKKHWKLSESAGIEPLICQRSLSEESGTKTMVLLETDSLVPLKSLAFLYQKYQVLSQQCIMLHLAPGINQSKVSSLLSGLLL